MMNKQTTVNHHGHIVNNSIRTMLIEEHKPTCEQCMYAFEHLNGYDSYVCDIDAHSIKLDSMSDACPLRPLPLIEQEAA